MRRNNAGYIQLPSSTDVAFHGQDNAKIPTFPNELWLYIAEFVPPRYRPKLLGINRMLFELVMSELYRRIDFVSSDSRILSDQLTSLQNPSLSKHVRALTLRPASTRDAMRARVNLKTQFTRYLLQSRGYIGELFTHSQPTSFPDSPLPAPKQRVEMFISTFQCLTNVEEFEVNWPYDVGPGRYAWTFSFFPQIWEALDQNLLKLSIDIDVFKMGDVVKDCGPCLQLEELHLTLRFGRPRGHLDEAFVPSFINKFSPTLRHLSIKSHEHHEFSKAFQHLGNFPQLNKLSLNIPLDIFHLRDTSGLRRLLRTHPKIEHFCMRYKPCCVESAHDGFQNDNDKHPIYSDSSLPAMHTLELGLGLAISNTNTDPLYKNITKLGNDLTTLILQDCIMEFDEIKTVLRLFPSHLLKKLLFMARELSHHLIDYLAQVCPALDSLSLHAELVVESDPISLPTYRNAFHDDWEVSDWTGFNYALIRCTNLNIERYATWALSDVSIMRYKQSVHEHVYDWKCMSAIANVVPSLRSFAGRGHMIPHVENTRDWTIKVETPLDLDALDWYRGPRWLI